MWSASKLDGAAAKEFVEGCRVETNGRMQCSKTKHRFKTGEVRITCTVEGKRRCYTLEAAFEEFGYLFKPTKGRKYGALSLQGLADLAAEDRAGVYRIFSIPATAAQGFDKTHPPPVQDEKPPPTKKRKLVEAEQAPLEDAGADGQGDEGMNEYEMQRKERIRQNRARMAELDLHSAAASFLAAHGKKPAAPASARGLASRRAKKKEPRAPQRASLRLQGIASDGSSVAEELRNGQIVLKGQPGAPGQAKPAPEENKPRAMPTGPAPFASTVGNPRSDAAFLEMLKKSAAGGSKGGGSKGGREAQSLPAQLRKLSLQESDVAKVTREGISHVAFHPHTAHLVVATGDKQGHVALWDVDKRTTHEAGEEDGDVEDFGAEDGVYLFRPHSQYVSGLRWAGGKLYTAAYDGVVRCLDPQRGEFTLLAVRPESEFSAFDCTADGRTLLVGDNDGNVEALDSRAPDAKGVPSVNLHDRKLNTLHLEPGAEQVLLSSSGDRSACTWDLRKLGPGIKSLASVSASNTILSAYYSLDGSQRMLTTGRDNTLRFYDGASLKEQAVMAHNNNTGRWVMPFRATIGPGGVAVCGSMKRSVDLFASSGEQITTLSSEYQTAISSRNVFNSDGTALAAATASGRVHIYR